MDSQFLILIMALTCLFFSKMERKAVWFAHLSAVCMIVISATFLAILGFIPSNHPIYDFFLGEATPVAMVLLLINLKISDLKSIQPKLIVIFMIGALGVMIGGIMAGALGAYLEIDQSKLAATQLIASYIGGGENSVAIREMIAIPNDLFVAVFAADNIVTSIWMAFTLYAARNSKPEKCSSNIGTMTNEKFGLEGLVFNIAISIAIVVCSNLLTIYVGFLHRYMYLTTLALVIGQIPYVKRNINGSYLLGSFLFLGFFFSIGAISSVSSFSDVSIFILALPFLIVMFQGVFVFGAARFLKVGGVEAATISQALVGGPATAIAIAHSRGWKKGTSIAMIFGILGYALGNYVAYLSFIILTSLKV